MEPLMEVVWSGVSGFLLRFLALCAEFFSDALKSLAAQAFHEKSTGDDGEDVYTRNPPLGELLLSHICVAALLAEW